MKLKTHLIISENTQNIRKEINTMTIEKIYLLAHESQLNKWAHEKDFLEKHPNNSISQYREKKLWNELMELEDEMKAKGYGYSK